MTESTGGERDSLAPVIPLFGSRADRTPTPSQTDDSDGAATWHATWIADRAASDRSAARAAHPATGTVPVVAPAGEDDAAAVAERVLLRKLRTRSLSIREARSVLREHELEESEIEGIVDRFLSLGYLDDAALAEQLIDKATSRKAQGRMAIAQGLSQRGIPREVIDEALDQLPDDEAERALEFARSKARGLDGLDRDTALRRLAGQLARRGYGSVALSVARQALDEFAAPPRRGVRFEP
ncbi:RecX family transcriptional regulator [Microbacterium oleivorans]|uniref:regulatory protein RecX n=1 Tax=Microbacterium oleivorans TaxID=273677 RepID=UPI0010A3D199|nr:regulatory protein RecX [Microbacterium oleivorans]THE07482.1 RecX family transcriptional regulator [Microbacterium oleivorans]